jgi:hypothetical protein
MLVEYKNLYFQANFAVIHRDGLISDVLKNLIFQTNLSRRP